MNITISNEDRAIRVLATMQEVDEAKSAKQKDVSLKEYDLIKTFASNNPSVDMHSKLGFDTNDIDAAAVKPLLDTVVAMPMGFTSLSSDLTSTKLRDAVNKHTAHIIAGGAVSDETLTNMSATLGGLQKQYEAADERLHNYKTQNYQKGMVNPIEMQENLDAGKKVFKSNHHLMLTKGFDKDGNREVYALEQKMGIQSTFASIDYLSNDLAVMEVHGDFTKAGGVLAVVGDTENKTYEAGKANGIKAQHTTGPSEAIALGLLLDINKKDPDGTNFSIVSVDTRNFEKFANELERINPQSRLSVFTNNRVEPLSMIGNNGKTQQIPSVFDQVKTMVKEARFTNNPRDADIQLMVMRSDDTLVDMYNKTKESVKEAHPNDPAAMYGRLSAVADHIVNDFKDNGNTLTDPINQAYEGRNVAGLYDKDLSETQKAAFASRKEKSINAYGEDAPRKGGFRPELQTIKPDSIDSRQASLLEDNSPTAAPEPKQLTQAPSAPRI